MKKLLCLVLAALCLLAVSCGGSSYRNDVPVSELVEAVSAVLPDAGNYVNPGDDYVRGMMEIDPAAFDSYFVGVSGAYPDEYGIFKAPDMDSVKNVEETVKNYLKLRVDSWMPEYMPEEYPKVAKASCEVVGQYVVYGILADNVKAGLFTAVKNALMK